MPDQKRSARSATKKKGYPDAKTNAADGSKFFRAYLDGAGSTILRPAFVAQRQSCCPAYGLNFFSPLSAQRLLLSQLPRPANGFNLFFSPRARSLVPAHLDSHIAQTFSSLSLPPQLLHSSTNVARSNAAAATLLMGLAYFFSLSLSLTALHLAFIATRPQLSAGNRFNSRRISK